MLGGTFDPIHQAHLIVAEEARVQLDLGEVIIIPTGTPWMKAGRSVTSGEHRLNMARLATSSNPFFKVSSMEVDRNGPSYTIDTLEALRKEYGDSVKLFFILGMDSIREFHRWKDPEKILNLANLVIVTRSGHNGFEIGSLNGISQGAGGRVVVIDGIAIDISGSALRKRLIEGQSIRYRVSDAVAEYIRKNGLYSREMLGA